MDDIVKIIIVDDHQIFRTGLGLILNGINNFKVIAEASRGAHLLEILKDNKPDVIFMDIQLPDIDGIELTKRIKKKSPEIKIIALTMFGEIEYFNKMIEAGANGFLLKKAENQELQDAIFAVMDDEYFFSKEFTNSPELNDVTRRSKIKIRLTNRESEVLNLICEGYSTSEMADKLFLSAHTIEGHRKSIMQKTGAKNTASLVKFAITHNLIS